MSKRVLLIDNYDSFVHILADEFQRRNCETAVFRSNWPVQEALAYIIRTQPDLLVFSPGPVEGGWQRVLAAGGAVLG